MEGELGRVAEHKVYILIIPKRFYRKFLGSRKVVLEYNETFDTLRIIPATKFPTNLKGNSIVRSLTRAGASIRVTIPQEIASKWIEKSRGYVVIWEDEDAINIRPRQQSTSYK
jgi:hypothetical protein